MVTDMVAGTVEVNMGADMELDKVADMVADKKEEEKCG